MCWDCNLTQKTRISRNDYIFLLSELMKRIALLTVLLCLFACSLYSPAMASSTTKPKIFILDSYHHGYEWSAHELDGLLSRLREVYPTLDPIVEHLDAKRKTEEDSISLMRRLILEKYADEKFDLVVALDNPALNLILSHRDELFKDVPLVFGGVNDFDIKMLEDHKNVTGVAQIMGVGQTIETALKLHPDTRKIVALHDYTSTGLAMRSELEKLAPNFSDRVKIIFSNPMTFEEAIDEMRSIPSDSLALILTFVTDRHGKTTSIDQSVKTLTSATNRPVYSTNFNAIGHGVVGGSVVVGQEHGRSVADIILRILDGEEIDKIPVDMSGDLEHIFDYRQLERFGIHAGILPAGGKIINKPLSFYEQHKTLTIGTISGALALTSFTIILLISFIKLRNSHSQLQGTRNSLSLSLRELETRNSLNTILLTFPGERMFSEVLNFLLQEMGCKYGIFGYFAEDGTFIAPGVTREAFPGVLVDPGTNAVFDVSSFSSNTWMQSIREKRAIIRNHGPFSTPPGHATIENTIVSPIIFNDVVVSSIHLANKTDGFSKKDADFLEMIAAQIAPVLFARLERDRRYNERQKAENELEKSQRFLEQIVENIPDMIFVKDVENLRFVRFNKAGEELLGYSREDLLGKNDYDFFLKEQADFFTAKDREVISRKEVTRIEHEEINTRHRGKRILRTKKLPVIDSNGEPQFLLGISTDVTEQKIAEDELKSAFVRLHQVFESIIGLIIIIDSKTFKIIYANKFSEELYGKKLEGQICYEVFNKLGMPCQNCSMEKVIELGGAPYQREYFNPVLNKHLLITERIIRWPDGRDVKFQFSMDTTDLRRSEHEKQQLQSQLLQAQKMEAVGTLAGGIAHDFNNLLQVVLGYSEVILAHKNMADVDYKNVQKIHQAGKRGADLVRSLLTFSRKMETKQVLVNVNHQITSLGSLLSRTIPKNIHIHLALGPDVNFIMADPSQIDQILMNLSLNARDAMPNGGTLTVETTNVKLDEYYCNYNLGARPGDYVRIVISDNGHGMTEETLDHMFEPFFSTKEVGKGTGLGLATVYGIVKQLGGHIDCESAPHCGTTFSIFLPAASDTQISAIETTEDFPLTGNETILLVDDEEEIRNLGAKILEKYGYNVILAANGAEAIEIYRNRKDSISLVVLDLIMPEKDGIQCSREILSMNPEAKILVASGFSVDIERKDFLEKTTMGIVEKPYGSKQLATAAREALDRDRP